MKTLFAVILVSFAVVFASCGAKTDVINNTYSTAEPGNVKGTVKLFDTNGVAISDASGVKVAMEGTKYSTMTATDGTWELMNVPAGTYPSLVYSKAGFPTFKSYQANNIGAYIIGGGGTQYEGFQNFYQISNISVDLVLRAFDDDYQEITYHDTLINSNIYGISDTLVIPNCQTIFSSRVLDTPPSNKLYDYYGVIFFGKNIKIDPTDPKSFLFQSPNLSQVTRTDYSSGIANFTVNKLLLQSAGFISGETVYCVAYFGNQFVESGSYTDPQSGMQIFTNFSPNHSEVRSFILP